MEGGTAIFQAEGAVKQGGEGHVWEPKSPVLHRTNLFHRVFPGLAQHLAHNRCPDGL